MARRTVATILVASMLTLQCLGGPVLADNQMGYQLLPATQVAALPPKGGKLGLNVGRAQQINSGGMTFELLRVNSVTTGSAGDRAGFRVGDQIIAVDGKVFPSVAAFASYVGSMPPAQRISVDYMPSSGGPKDAQRVDVTLGGNVAPGETSRPESTGLSTGAKIAIGVGAAALFGCYKLGCFSRKAKPGAFQRPAVR